jgi:cyclopropane-fatty-acyl-phospholipid synthase
MGVSIHPAMGQAEAPTLGSAEQPGSQPREAAREASLVDRQLAIRVQRRIDVAAVRLELWDGTSFYAGTQPPIGDLVIGDRRVLAGLALNPDLYFGEAFMSGRLDVRGSLEQVVEALTRAAPTAPSWRERVAGWLAARNTIGHARRNVHHHYDLGNAFYRLWLDRELVYTCAYYASPDMSLDEAQAAKLDLVCRKLRLRPGDSVIETGCGWGALALHMARRYGARVKAFNVSREQLAYARDRARREGLSDRVEFIDDDYRNVTGTFDAFASIGMLEHVGPRNLGDLADVVRRCVRRDGGRGILHFIGRDVPRPVNAWITRRIFPGSYTPTLAEVTSRILGPAGMSVTDVENLRLHYARTLAHWGERYRAARDQVRATYSNEFDRAWSLYLAGSQAAFTVGCMQLFQIVFTPRESAPPSWTRADPFEPGVPE